KRRTPDHHPERRSDRRHPGLRLLRADSGDVGSAQDSCSRRTAGEGGQDGSSRGSPEAIPRADQAEPERRMRQYSVIVTEHALLDLDDIAHYITLHDSPQRAEYVAQGIEQAFAGLATLPNRGNHPRELLELGNRSFREVRFKPYRIVYRVFEREVH